VQTCALPICCPCGPPAARARCSHPALEPDVSIVHVQRADRMGNLVIEGFSTHEPEMIRASRRVIASCEELVSTDEIRAHPEQTSIPFLHVSAVVVQRFGAYPTSVHRYYDY